MRAECSTIIVGAGASGLMCGAYLEGDFLILEAADKPAGKLAVSGGGRCNFANEQISVENYTGQKEFIGHILQRFSFSDVLEVVKKWKIPFEVCKNRQLFCANSSKEIISPLLEYSKGRIVKNCKLVDVSFEKEKFFLQTSQGEYVCDRLIVASGGLSYPVLGASDIGHSVAKKFGHSIVQPKPALVGFTVQPDEYWFKELSGVAILAKVSVGSKSFTDNILFAHKGISGPAILNASLYWEKGSVVVDFLPQIYNLDTVLVGQKQITTVLGLPKSFSKAFLNAIGVEDKRVDRLTQSDKERLLRLKNYEFAPAGTFGFTRAEITKGGVSVVDINPQTMESRLQKGVYFIGEVLDVNGELGGYNFHWAFASAVVCAAAVNATAKS